MKQIRSKSAVRVEAPAILNLHWIANMKTVFCALALLALSSRLEATIYTWDGGAGDGLWRTNAASWANWVGDTYHTSDTTTNIYVFTSAGYGGVTTITLTNHNPNISNLTINADAPNLTFNIDNNSGTAHPTRLDFSPGASGAETLTVLAGSHLIKTVGSGTIVTNIQLQGLDSQVWNIAGGATMTINSIIEGNASTRGFTKTGSGTLVLGATNSFGGKVAINAGTVAFVSASSFGASPASAVADQVTINGGTLQAMAPNAVLWAQNRGITYGSGGCIWNVDSGVSLAVAAAQAGSGGYTKT